MNVDCRLDYLHCRHKQTIEKLIKIVFSTNYDNSSK